MATRRTGIEYEREVMGFLSAMYHDPLIIRSAGSRGPFDLYAIFPERCVCVQCKASKPSKREIEAVEAHSLRLGRRHICYLFVKGRNAHRAMMFRGGTLVREFIYDRIPKKRRGYVSEMDRDRVDSGASVVVPDREAHRDLEG